MKAGEEPPCIPQKLPYAKVFDETHGGSFAFIMREGNLKRSERGGDLREEECGLSPRVGPENCPTRKFLTEHMGAPWRLWRRRNLNRFEQGGDLGERMWFESPCVGPENCPT